MTRTANLSSCRDVSVDSAAVRRVRLMAGRSHRARKTIATSRECADNGSHAPDFESNLPQKLPCGTVAGVEVDARRAFTARISKNHGRCCNMLGIHTGFPFRADRWPQAGGASKRGGGVDRFWARMRARDVDRGSHFA